MEKRFARNGEKLKENPERLAQIRQAIDRAKANSTSERSLVARLRTEHIDAVFRRTEDGPVYGATFVDHGSRTVLNASALGQEYAARTWDEWFKNPPTEQTETPAQTYEPFPVQETGQAEASAPHPDYNGDPPLIGQTLLEGLDVFGTLFEPGYEVHEYIDPEFRLLHRKKRKKKQQGPRF